MRCATGTRPWDWTCSNLVSLNSRWRMRRRGRILQVAKGVAAKAKADWPELLGDAPGSMRRAISERLAGGVALAKIPFAPAPARRAPPSTAM